MPEPDFLEVRQSGLKMFLLSMAGIPLLVLGVEVLRTRSPAISVWKLSNKFEFVADVTIIEFFQNQVYGRNPEVLEWRDYIWATAMIVVGLIIAGYGVAELINPRPVVATTLNGLRLRLGHPGASPTVVPWEEVIDVGSEELDDEGESVPVLWLKVANPERLPAHPWAARWLDANTLALLASDWEADPAAVAGRILGSWVDVTKRSGPLIP